MTTSFKNLTIIAAIGRNNELGRNNDLIWTFREDLQTFKAITMGNYIVMGENTYHSLPVELKGRTYLVLSPNLKSIPEPGGRIFPDLQSFLEFCTSNPDKEILVCGGGMVYKLLMPYSSKMILTEIDDKAPDADVYFPEFNLNDWTITQSTNFTDNETKYTRNFYTRNKEK